MISLPEFATDYKRLEKLREYDFAPTSILDVGASGGVWSGTCSMIFPEAEYFLIEPLIYPEEYWPVPGVNHHWIRKTVGSRNDNVEMIVP